VGNFDERPWGVPASGVNAVWVTRTISSSDGRVRGAVSVIDLDTHNVTDTIPVGYNAPTSPFGVAVFNESVWVANNSQVSVIDLDTHTITDTIPVNEPTAGLAVSDDAVWVTNDELDRGRWRGRVSAIDLDTHTVTDTIPVSDEGGESSGIRDGATGLAASDDAVWVTNNRDGTVSVIDLDTHTVTDTIPVGGNPSGVAVSDDAVWVTNDGDGTVYVIDLDTYTQSP